MATITTTTRPKVRSDQAFSGFSRPHRDQRLGPGRECQRFREMVRRSEDRPWPRMATITTMATITCQRFHEMVRRSEDRPWPRNDHSDGNDHKAYRNIYIDICLCIHAYIIYTYTYLFPCPCMYVYIYIYIYAYQFDADVGLYEHHIYII